MTGSRGQRDDTQDDNIEPSPQQGAGRSFCQSCSRWQTSRPKRIPRRQGLKDRLPDGRASRYRYALPSGRGPLYAAAALGTPGASPPSVRRWTLTTGGQGRRFHRLTVCAAGRLRTVYGPFGFGSDGGSLTGGGEGSSPRVAPLQVALVWQGVKAGHRLSVETVWSRPAGRLVPLASSCHAGPISLPRVLPISRQG